MSAKRTRISPRIRIRENDGALSVKPASTISGLFVGSVAPFSDNRTLVFSQSNNILYPAMLPSGSSLADITGITAKGRPTPGASDVHFNLTTSSFSPFDETHKLFASESFYLDPDPGMPSSFSGPLTSRMAIRVDISPSAEKYIYRCPQRHIDNAPLPLEFTEEGTGFCYFNFSSKTWDNVGNVDPLTGASLKTDQAAGATPVTYFLTESFAITSSVYYTGQFVPPSSALTRGDGVSKMSGSEVFAMGITNVGTPTVAFLAPAASKYHAKQQQTLKMSDYISQPFLLERIEIDLPIVARRTHSSSSYYNPWTRRYPANDQHLRDMDNYVVFLYRQVRNIQPQGFMLAPLARDNSTDITGSNRFLIASASMCFYNSDSFKAGVFEVIPQTAAIDALGEPPYHTPNFKHNFKMSTTDGVYSQEYYTGSVNLKMVPEIRGSGFNGVSFLPSTMSNTENGSQIRARDGWRINYVQHAWPGTAGSLALGSGDAFTSQDYSGKTKGNLGIVLPPASFKTLELSSSVYKPTGLTSSYTNFVNVDEFYWKSSLFSENGVNFNPTLWESAGSCASRDPRSFKGSFGPSQRSQASFVVAGPLPKNKLDFIGGVSSISDERSRPSPIVLLPSDELVLGIDAGIAPFMRDCSSITGSFLLLQKKAATLTLYGSQVVNGERRQNMRSLQTLSEAVHLDEVDTPILDEFLLEPSIANIGSYYAPLATGSFVSGSTPSRGIQGYAGFPSLLPFAFDPSNVLLDWYKYPAQVVLTEDRSVPIDPGNFSRFVFRSDKFGQPAHMLQPAQNIAANVRRQTILPGSAVGGTPIASYPVTNIFTGSTSFSRNTSLHATSSRPYTES